MSDRVKFAAILLATFTLMYLASVFISLQPNPLLWPEFGRAAFVVLGLYAGLVAASFPGWYD